MATVLELQTVSAASAAGASRDVRAAVPAALFTKQIGLLMRDYPYDSMMAARVLDQLATDSVAEVPARPGSREKHRRC
ncbi:hypothetical protein ACH4OW_34175 [Streptomyces sp. NPDC017056]|uniref:hypothetical protein n=1 Tax=Streptomyces sp. NPDC017056 TaxID=3364973 RepID=UPI0037B36DAB